MLNQLPLFEIDQPTRVRPFHKQLLKWIGNKQRFAHEIIQYFPEQFNTYYEPFLGSGAVLGTLSPSQAVASDALRPLMEIWQTLSDAPDSLKQCTRLSTLNRSQIGLTRGIHARWERLLSAPILKQL